MIVRERFSFLRVFAKNAKTLIINNSSPFSPLIIDVNPSQIQTKRVVSIWELDPVSDLEQGFLFFVKDVHEFGENP